MVTILTPDAIAPFQQWLSGKGLSENTTKGYSTDVRMFFTELNLTSCPAVDLPLLASNWMNKARNSRMAAKSVRRRATSIRSFATFSGLPPVLVDYRMPPLEEHVPHPLPGLNTDLQNMLDLCSTEERAALIAFMGLMGLRLFEALGIEVSHFDIPTMMLTVWGKRGKKRTLPITPRAWEYIGPAYLTSLVNKRRHLVHYSDRGARNFVTELGARAGISRPISSHDLRATFATLSYAKHRDIEALRIWLGHDSIETTQMYVAIAIEVLRAIGEF